MDYPGRNQFVLACRQHFGRNTVKCSQSACEGDLCVQFPGDISQDCRYPGYRNRIGCEEIQIERVAVVKIKYRQCSSTGEVEMIL